MSYKLLLSLGIAFAAGCASGSRHQVPQETDPAKLASVTIYRTSVFFHSGNPERPFFYIDGAEVGKLGTGMAVTTQVQPGKHVITVREPILFMPAYENGRIEHEFEAGKTYYLRYSRDFAGAAMAGSTPVVTGSTNFSFGDEASYLQRK